ncbi:histidinol phosphate aminotransferase [Pseudalgibacter alginicilyticus]|uniref:Histidinol-phosphate aminotransferase n=1 Tax=Pseudalgibacter alginicilyticus TaxID=1736674 RepID=A0A0P0CI07_9FLAO|nr:histidinol-phosphate transaminase [Pseudalgibacter alginicilyticus]ALJ03988.1 histidinol phosphate aminotransferase [Pseudalgibacter alginicilyticus]
MKQNFNISNLLRSNIKALKPYSSARDEFQGVTGNMVFLDANENPFQNGVNRYPDPQQNKVKMLLSKIKGVSTKNILLGNGSDEVLDLIFRAFCEPNQDNIITLPPTYGMYEVLANINAIDIIKVNLSDNFEPKVESVLEAVKPNSKILFLCSPNNPSGNSFKASDVEKLLNSFNGLVVIDEAYIDFSNEKSWLERLNEFPNLIITQTLSKAYGMAGIRLGICYASEEIISVLNRIKPPYNVNELTQLKAIERLEKEEEVANEIKSIIEQRTLLISKLKTIDFISEIYPTDANFVLVKVDDATKRYNQLIEKGIVIRNRTTQAGCENTLRLTVGTADENKILIDTLKSI